MTPLISVARAATAEPVVTPHQLSAGWVFLVATLLAAMAVLALHSWWRRRHIALGRRQAESALRTTEGRLRQLSGQLPVALFEFVAVPEPRFLSVSAGISRLLPTTASAIQTDPGRFFACIHPDDVPMLRWHEPVPKTSDVDWIGRSLMPDGSVRWLQIRTTTEIDAQGGRVTHGVILDVTALKEAQLELSRLAAHREMRIEQERARLAREVHDELGQVLTAARMQMQLLRGDLGSQSPDVVARLADIESLLGDAYRGVKTVAADLRPGALNLGLTAAVEWLVDRLLKPANISCEIRFAPEADQLAETQAIALFRIVQESLGNVVKHAGARHVSLGFAFDGGRWTLTVTDDGCGFDPEAVDRRTHFGLLGLKERAEAQGATLRVESCPGAGTTLTLESAP